MRKYIIAAALLSGISSIAMAQNEKEAAPLPSPNAIVDTAPASEWVAIKQSDLMVMDLAPDRDGKKRRVIIQLMPRQVSKGWIRNIRKLAAAKYWDDTAIIRVQDNYVTQWGDPNNGEEGAKPLPEGLESIPESDYTVPHLFSFYDKLIHVTANKPKPVKIPIPDNYSQNSRFVGGWPVAYANIVTPMTVQVIDNDNLTVGEAIKFKTIVSEPFKHRRYWPVHCYGMVGVGRNLSPDTGDGSSLYTVIGHAPRHLDRNIALVGRIILGMEHMSSLPRGTGDLGFYETPEERTAIISVRMGQEISDIPAFEYLNTEGDTFAKYAEARANRRDPFFNVPAGGADICNIPVPIRVKKDAAP